MKPRPKNWEKLRGSNRQSAIGNRQSAAASLLSWIAASGALGLTEDELWKRAAAFAVVGTRNTLKLELRALADANQIDFDGTRYVAR